MPEPAPLAEILHWLFRDAPTRTPAIERRARLLFLDTLGCMVAGLAKTEPRALVRTLSTLAAGPVLLPGAGAALTPGAAAYVAGIAACWDEACEGLARAHGRPGLHAFPPALCLALAQDRSLGDALSALVAGYEVAGRLGECLRIPPGMHVDGTWGTFGAAAAAAFLMDLGPDAAVTAIEGAACHLPWSLYLPITVGANVRNAYVGEAAMRGILAAAAGAAGIAAPSDAIATFDRLALHGDPETKTMAPAGEWLIEQGYLKAYAAVRHVHYGAAAAVAWRGAHGGDAREITALDLSIYGEAITYCGNRAPSTPIQAQFSLSYGLAWTLVNGDLGPDAYTEAAFNDDEVCRLEAMVTIAEDTDLSRSGLRGARLTVARGLETDDVTVTEVPGDPAMPLSLEDVRDKFLRYAAPEIGTERAATIAAGVLEAPVSDSLQSILAG